jgi:hypothetical protein
MAAQTEPDWTQYNLRFPASPVDGPTAASTFNQRANIWLEFAACGQENAYLEATLRGLGQSANPQGNTPDPNFLWSDSFLGQVMAKLQWLKLGNSGCDSTYNVVGDFYDRNDFPDEPHIEARIRTTFGTDCSSSTEGVLTTGSSNVFPPTFTTVRSQISAACLKAQINFALNQVQEGDTFPGTDPLPCDVAGSHKGDWDVRMKALMRILFLDSFPRGDPGVGSVLTVVRSDGRTTRDYVLQDLITVDGGPGPDTYSWMGCGDNEKDTGSPQDREDENSAASDFFDSVGDVLTWLCRRLILLVVLLTVAAVLASITVITGVPVAVLGALGTAALFAQVPETENHRLMIESTRFLNNQIIMQDLGPGNASGISNDQGDVKNWLLKKFQSIAKNDFVEYNARPYQVYSLSALRNLADFSTDADVRNGAQMLLEYSAAKFALGSNQGRRLVPFRRRLPGVSCILGQECDECNIQPGCHTPAPTDLWHAWFEIFHPKAFDDHEVSLALLFNGQTERLLNGMVATDTVFIPAATAQFVINPLIVDLAIRKDVPYFQRIHHAGYEAYSSSPSVLITAGGIETDHANHVTIAGLPIHSPLDPLQDIGAGLPTTVMFTGQQQVTGIGQSRMTIGDFITFQGSVKVEGTGPCSTNASFFCKSESFTDNLCVWHNFACGTNVQIPKDILQCLSGPDNHNLYFFDSSSCPGYTNGPTHFFFAMFLTCPQNACITISPALSVNQPNAGFIEVVDSPSDSFADFRATVDQNFVLANPTGFGGFQGCTSGGPCIGDYLTASGHRLQLDLRGHQDDSNSTGIIAVDGVSEKHLGDWSFAEGDIMNSQGDGVITINNPRLGTQLILDFSNSSHPCRRTGPNQPCTQQ